MIELLNALGGSWAGYFGLAVLQHTLFLGVLFLGLYLLRNARAGLRYALCLIGTVKLLLPPFLPAGFLALPGSPDSVPTFVMLARETPRAMGPLPGVSAAAQLSRESGVGLPAVLFAVWGTVVLFILLRTALSYLRLRRELAGAIPVTGRIDGLLVDGAEIEIRKTAGTPVALTFGLVRPKIYVPEAWDVWSDGCRRMVIAHEMAHLRSWDRLGQVLQAIVRAVYFFHPLVWLLDRRMDGYREMMCDDAVTDEVPGRVTEYSRCLVEIAEQVMHGPASLTSASAFLKHKNGLMNRVRYQLEVGKMKHISVRTRILVFAGLLMLVLPLSWYCGNAETMEAPAADRAAAKKAKASMEDVDLVLFSVGEVRLDGETFALEDLGKALHKRFPSERDNLLIKLSCGADVPMEMISLVHKTLVDMDLRKVLYEDGPEKAMPLELPSEELQKKLQIIAAEHAMQVKVNLPGFVEIDGERVKITELKQAVEKGLVEDPHMVVSLSWAPAASYDDFLVALAQTKAGGAQRIAVQVGE